MNVIISPMEMDEQQLIEQINAKAPQAFHDLFKGFYRSLVYFAMRYVERQEVAEDLVQELFAKLWEEERHYLSYVSFKTYLYSSIKHAALDWLKHRDVENRYLSYSLLNAESGDELDRKMMEEEIYRTLLQVVDELPGRCKEIFLLHLQGKKNEEIAGLLQLSVLTVKTQKKKAVHYIKERMGNLYVILVICGLMS